MKTIEYKHNYIVYEDGRIWMKRWNRFAKITKDRTGYAVVKINGKLERVHRIVANCFIPNPYNKPDINHINGIKSDNSVNNLEWVTKSENINHSLSILGNNHGNNRIQVIATNIETGKKYEFISQKECGRVLGLCARHITACMIGSKKSIKGYTFQYK